MSSGNNNNLFSIFFSLLFAVAGMLLIRTLKLGLTLCLLVLLLSVLQIGLPVLGIPYYIDAGAALPVLLILAVTLSWHSMFDGVVWVLSQTPFLLLFLGGSIGIAVSSLTHPSAPPSQRVGALLLPVGVGAFIVLKNRIPALSRPFVTTRSLSSGGLIDYLTAEDTLKRSK